eukprot:g16445.t1
MVPTSAKPIGSDCWGSGSGGCEHGHDEFDAAASVRRSVRKKRSQQANAVPLASMAIKTEEEGDGVSDSCSSTIAGNRKRARPAGPTPTVPGAVKPEEGPGNWWGEGNEDLRVDARGRVVLVDPEMYYEHHYEQRTYIRIAASVLISMISGRSLGRPSALTPQLVEHLSKVWHRPRRPLAGVLAASGSSETTGSGYLGVGGGEGSAGAAAVAGGVPRLAEGLVAVALGRRVATIPLRPWENEAALMAPLEQLPSSAGRGPRGSGRSTDAEERAQRAAEGLNLYGQVLAWSDDGSVVAVSTPTGGVACISHPSGACLATVSPRSASSAAGGNGGGLGASLGAGVAGVALRGVLPGNGKMEVLVLTFDAVLAFYSFSVGGPAGAATGGGRGEELLSPVCEQRLRRWHASTCAMAFHGATDTVAVAGPSGASRPGPSLSVTLWRVNGGAASAVASGKEEPITGGGGGGGARSRTGGTAAAAAAARTAEGRAAAAPRLAELHFVALEGGSVVVPAPRAGLDRAPPGTVPALLPLFFPGLRAVAPPVQVVFNPPGNRLAVLDIAGGVTLVETSEDAASASPLGRRCLSADGRSWRRDTGDASVPSPPGATAAGAAAASEGRPPRPADGPATAASGGAGVPRAVSVGWWSEIALGVMTSSGDLAFLDARLPTAPGASAPVAAEEITTAFQGFGGRGGRGGAARAARAPRPPPLGPRCTVWFAGDGRRAAVCWPGAGEGGGRWGGGGGMAGVRSAGAGGSVVGLLSLGTAEEAVEGRVRRGLLGEALDLAVACGLDAGGVRAGLWRKAIESGSFSEEDVEQHLVGTSDDRWVISETLSRIGLAATEAAASALVKEGLRRCDLLLCTTLSATFPAAGSVPASQAAQGLNQPSAATVESGGGDGWDFDDDEDFDDSAVKTAAAVGGGALSMSGSAGLNTREGKGAAPGAPRPVWEDGGRAGVGGRDGGKEVARLRARLASLRDLLETCLAVDMVQGLAFDVARLREFLALASGPGKVGGAMEVAVEPAPVEQHKWEDGACREVVLRRALMGFARKGETPAVGMLFERHPLETLPVRLEALSAIPETLDPASYASLLPCHGGDMGIDIDIDSLFAGATVRASAAAASGDQVFYPPDPASPCPRPSLTEGTAPLPAAEAAAAAAAVARAAVERQHDPRVLAPWYAGRAREFDARAGQVRHAATLTQLGVGRVLKAGEGEGAGARAGAGDGADAAVEELLRLDLMLQHLASLVYAGSVSPAITVSAWEGMGLEERMTAVLSASSRDTVAEDVRAFARAAAAEGGERAPRLSGREAASSSSTPTPHTSATVPPHLESVMVRVLGVLMKTAPSAARMEACAAVAKASRPEVAENDRLIRKPEALLTLLLDACYAWAETAPDERALEAAWDLLECVPTRQESVDASLQDRVDALEGHLYATQVLQTYGLAPPLTRYLEMGGGAEGTSGRDVERYTSFAKGLVDQMCAVAMERAGMGWTSPAGGVGNSGGLPALGVGRIWRRGTRMVGAGAGAGGRGGGRIELDGASREEITRLHKDVSRLQSNAWQGLGAKWAIRRVLQAVVEAGQFDVAQALVESSVANRGDASGRGAGADAGGEDDEREAETKRVERRAIAEDVLLAAATAHFNAAPSFEEGEELQASQRWLDLLPWSSPALDRERRLYGAGRLAHDLGAFDLVPLQLRLRLGLGGVNVGDRDGGGVVAPAGAMEVIREVLRSNPEAFRDGGSGGSNRDESGMWAAGGREGGDGPNLFGLEKACACGEPTGSDGGSGSGVAGSGGRGSPSPPPLSVPFLRVAELTMQAFGMRVLPGDVDSWEARSLFLGQLMSAASSGPPSSEPPAGRGRKAGVCEERLRAVVSILGIWESEELEPEDAEPNGVGATPPLPAAEKVRRLRAEVAVRALVDPSSPPVSTLEAAAHGTAAGENLGDPAREGGPGTTAGAIVELMREWWPRLISAAAEAGEWEVVCRCFVSTGCAGFTSEEFEEGLWSKLEASTAPALASIKIGLSSLHVSRHRAAATLLASEYGSASASESGVGAALSDDDDVLHLALSSPILPQLAKTPLYPSLVSIALRGEGMSCGPSQHRPQGRRSCPAAGTDGVAPPPPPPTSSTEFLLLAMACAGGHGRAAALACEASGIHPGLRTLDGGLMVLGRWLRERGRRGRVSGASALGDGGAGSAHGVAGWFEPWMVRLREAALKDYLGGSILPRQRRRRIYLRREESVVGQGRTPSKRQETGERQQSPVTSDTGVAMKRSLCRAAILLAALLAFGGVWVGGQRECCAAIWEGSDGHQSFLPKQCDGHSVACESMGISVDHVDWGDDVAAMKGEIAYLQQLGVRQQPGCAKDEWEGRCPASSTMLLAGGKTGGCRAAGCVTVKEDGSSTSAAMILQGEGADSAVLRAVTQREGVWMSTATGERKLRSKSKEFAKAENRFRNLLEAAMTPEPNVPLLKSLLEVAALRGFSPSTTMEARQFISKHELLRKPVRSFLIRVGMLFNLLRAEKERSREEVDQCIRRLEECGERVESTAADAKSCYEELGQFKGKVNMITDESGKREEILKGEVNKLRKTARTLKARLDAITKTKDLEIARLAVQVAQLQREVKQLKRQKANATTRNGADATEELLAELFAAASARGPARPKPRKSCSAEEEGTTPHSPTSPEKPVWTSEYGAAINRVRSPSLRNDDEEGDERCDGAQEKAGNRGGAKQSLES